MDGAHRLTDEMLESIERRVDKIYKSAEKDIEKKAEEYFDKFKKADEQKRQQVENGEITEGEYAHWRRGKILYGKRYKRLKENIANAILKTNQEATDYINGELSNIYTINYNQLERDVEGIEGYMFELVDEDTVRILAEEDPDLLPYKSIDPDADIAWNKKNINTQILQGVLEGESIDKIADRIMHVQDMNRKAALRTARTIITAAENKGRQDSYERAKADGIILKKEWLSSAQPGRTRDWHLPSAFSSLTVDIEKPFSNDLGLIMYPGDPGAHPANVYNCRCSMKAKVMGFKKV